MQLLSIRLDRYRVLKDFSLEFKKPTNGATTYTLDLLVGINGTGKSTLLHAIAEIFQRLATGSHFNFGFEISYKQNATTEVSISNLSDTSLLPYLRWKVTKDDKQQLGEGKKIPDTYLPPLVITFTTGSEQEWELKTIDINQSENNGTQVINGESNPIEPLNPETIRAMYLTELPGLPASTEEEEENQQTVSPLPDNYLFIKTRHLPLVTLCGLLADKSSSNLHNRLYEALDEANIAGLQGFSLKFRLFNGVDDFSFVKQLAQYASYTIRQGTDYLLVYDLTQEDYPTRVNGFLTSVGTTLDLFRNLAHLYDPQDGEATLREVNLFLQRKHEQIDNSENNTAPLHLLEWLSDGEQSFLGRLCLFSLLGDTEALILLDEPEVHFNDVWKREIVRMLDEMLQNRDSHVLITTHSSIALTDVSRENILVLQRGDTYTQNASPPIMETLAADPSDIITNVFGASQATGAQGLERIKRGIHRALKQSTPEKQEEELRKLSRQVAPGYWSFLVLHQIDDVRNQPRTEQ